ncbi:GNAT family N-acetyltransferase [Roseomonas sp. SSH11]|uniref:GNAT family N-acetyltransferase n=1 Tax=Pararoseomonas baculiformis TaxID=2820812 RepID=A0ABS4AET8_9PROT|nr:GNAT family N-acetyltransferase [Pararoseomonas baculiformis]MBP0445545.1 GNAT family N-acetyltransferase [Pararoseomonas baculiformis]
MAAGTRYGVDIRAALPADSADLAALLGGTPRQMAQRLEAMPREAGAVLVATGWNGAAIGVIALNWHHTLAADRPLARISALAVAQEERRNGIGRLLIKAGAQAARVAGCDLLEAAAPGEGEAAGAFLQALGFAPAGQNLARPLRKRAQEMP